MKHKHKWIVYSTSLCPPTIMVYCDCGADGWIKDFTEEEWDAAFYAPSNNYPYEGKGKVTIRKTVPNKKRGEP